MHSTDLTGTIPTELGHLSKLTDMILEDLLVTGDVPIEICELTNINGGVLDEITIDCEKVKCSGNCSCSHYPSPGAGNNA